MKKILIFSLAYLPWLGGAELATKEITKRISDMKFDMVTLRFDRKSSKFERIGNINVYRVGKTKLFFPFVAFFKGWQLHRQNNYCAIWSIMANRAGFAALFFKFLKKDVKFLLTLQEGDKLDYAKKRAGLLWPFVSMLFKKIFLKADYIQAISNYLAVWARQMGAKCPIEVVPNGVDLENFQFPISNFQKTEFKKNLNIKEGEKIVITTSRLVLKNAVADAIEAMQYLSENIKFLILGTGPLEKILKSKVKSLRLENRILFLGQVQPKEVPKYLSMADVFVRPSLSEGLGSSFLEAMAGGVPVIGTNVGGIPDFLSDPATSSGQVPTGLFCEIKNPKSIADKIKLLLNDSELREKIVANAKDLVSKNYNWDLVAGKIHNIFINLKCGF